MSIQEENSWRIDLILSDLINFKQERWRCFGLQRGKRKSCDSEEVHRSGGRPLTQIVYSDEFAENRSRSLLSQRDKQICALYEEEIERYIIDFPMTLIQSSACRKRKKVKFVASLRLFLNPDRISEKG